MTHLGVVLLLAGAGAILLAALGLTAAGAWYNAQDRRIRRSLRKVLQGDLHPLVMTDAQGRGVGFDFGRRTMAVTWDGGAWCLVYRIEELLGVELIVDDWVTGWAFVQEGFWRAEPGSRVNDHVSLRLVLDDPRHDDFTLDLWSAADPGEPAAGAWDAVEEGNTWLARIEDVLRGRPLSAIAAVAPKPARRERPCFRQLELTEGCY